MHTDSHCLSYIHKPSTSHFVQSDQFKDITVSPEFDSYNLTNSAKKSLGDDLSHCFLKHHANKNFINYILSVLGSHGHSELPKDARTLMNTPRSHRNQIINMKPGKYIHFGLIKHFKHIIKIIW